MRRVGLPLLILASLAATAHAQPEPDPPSPWNGDEPLDPGTEAELDQLLLRALPEIETPPDEGLTLEQLDAELDAEEAAAAPAAAPAVPPAPDGPVPFWGPPRGFLAGMIDLGFLFLQPRFHFGYGVPHQLWVGAELNPIISGSGIGVYGGLRGEVPWGDLRVGARYRFNWTRSFLEALDGYDHLQLRDRTGPNANYVSAEAQLSLDVPVETTAFVAELTATYVIPFEQGMYIALYEDTLQVITVSPGWIWSAMIGWRFHFGPDDAFSVEPGAELVHLVERDAFVFRAGLRAAIRLWPDLSVRLIAMPGLVSPDRLGGGGGHSFLLGLRYRWATDAPRFGDGG